jgi:hypothetical protein
MRERFMANEKNPSIYFDRGTIGSSTELDEYGVWVKSEPMDLSSTGAEAAGFVEDLLPEEPADFSAAMEGLPDFGDPGEEAPDLPKDDFDFSGGDLGGEGLDFDIPLEISAEEDAEDDMDDFFEDPSGSPKDFPLEETYGAGELSPDADIAGTGVLNVSPEFDDPEKEPVPGAAEKPSSGTELSNQLLMRIVGELSAIKDELSILKKELSALHQGGIPRETAAAEEKGQGFFDEGEDEKIALTGDELDKILHTADFTEETGADAADTTAGDFPAEDEESLAPPVSEELPEEAVPEIDFSEETLDFTPEESLLPEAADVADTTAAGDFSTEDEESPTPPVLEEPSEEAVPEIDFSEETLDFIPEVGEEEIDLGDGLGFEAPAEEQRAEEEISLSPDDVFSIEDALGKDIELLGGESSLDLRELQETGVEPMTPAPEDISYLETEPEQDVFDEVSLDLSDPVGDETGDEDLTGEPEPPVEPLTVDLDLNLEESLPEEGAIGVFDEPAPPVEGEEIRIDIPIDGITEAIPDAEFEEVPALEKTAEDESGEPGEPEEPFEQFIPEGFEDETGGDASPEEALGDFEEPFIAGLPELPEDALTEEPEPDTGEAVTADIPSNLKRDLKSVLSYMDQLLESLPEEKIEEFAKSEYFDTYKKVFEELGIS